MLNRIGLWFRSNLGTILLGIGVLCLLAAIALLVNPVRLVMYGNSAEGVVTSVDEHTLRDAKGKESVRSTATIRFTAGGKDMAIRRSWSRDRGSFCMVGCYSKGDRLKLLYLADEPEVAEVGSFFGLFGWSLMLILVGAMGIVMWTLERSERSASTPGG